MSANHKKRHCRRFLACIMPLRLPKSCMLGSRLWKNPASSYIMFEFLRQLGHKACTLFGKIFKDLTAFLESTRNKRQFSRQISFVAFNLGLIHKGVESLGGGQEEWSNLVCPCLSIESCCTFMRAFLSIYYVTLFTAHQIFDSDHSWHDANQPLVKSSASQAVMSLKLPIVHLSSRLDPILLIINHSVR